jgi:hypothetical protein
VPLPCQPSGTGRFTERREGTQFVCRRAESPRSSRGAILQSHAIKKSSAHTQSTAINIAIDGAHAKTTTKEAGTGNWSPTVLTGALPSFVSWQTVWTLARMQAGSRATAGPQAKQGCRGEVEGCRGTRRREQACGQTTRGSTAAGSRCSTRGGSPEQILARTPGALHGLTGHSKFALKRRQARGVVGLAVKAAALDARQAEPGGGGVGGVGGRAAGVAPGGPGPSGTLDKGAGTEMRSRHTRVRGNARDAARVQPATRLYEGCDFAQQQSAAIACNRRRRARCSACVPSIAPHVGAVRLSLRYLHMYSDHEQGRNITQLCRSAKQPACSLALVSHAVEGSHVTEAAGFGDSYVTAIHDSTECPHLHTVLVMRTSTVPPR